MLVQHFRIVQMHQQQLSNVFTFATGLAYVLHLTSSDANHLIATYLFSCATEYVMCGFLLHLFLGIQKVNLPNNLFFSDETNRKKKYMYTSLPDKKQKIFVYNVQFF